MCRLGQKFQELESEWLERHCLRVLPGAKDFANSTSSLFGALKETFDFQVGALQIRCRLAIHCKNMDRISLLIHAYCIIAC